MGRSATRLLAVFCALWLFAGAARAVTAVEAVDGRYIVEVTVPKSRYGPSVSESHASSLARSRLMVWLLDQQIEWPAALSAADRAFLLDLYRRAEALHATIQEFRREDVSARGTMLHYRFSVPKDLVRLSSPTWPQVLDAIARLAQDERKIEPLVHLELADRYPDRFSHRAVAQRLRKEIGPGFLDFVTGRPVSGLPHGPPPPTVPGDLPGLARLVGERPYDIDTALPLVGALWKSPLTAVACRVIRQAQRGSKLSPAYPVIRDLGRSGCAGTASIFAEGVSDSQIARMRKELTSLRQPLDGMAASVVDSFGEVPAELSDKQTVAAQGDCGRLGLGACLSAFNDRPSASLAKQLAAMLSERGFHFLSAAFAHQAWVWDGEGRFVDHIVEGYPVSARR